MPKPEKQNHEIRNFFTIFFISLAVSSAYVYLDLNYEIFYSAGPGWFSGLEYFIIGGFLLAALSTFLRILYGKSSLKETSVRAALMGVVYFIISPILASILLRVFFEVLEYLDML